MIKEKTAESEALPKIETPDLSFIDNDTKIKNLTNKIIELKKTITELDNNVCENEQEQIELIESEIELINSQLTKIDGNKDVQNRIDELNKEHKKYGVELAKLEKIIDIAFDYEKAIITATEQSVNTLFTNVQFRMFEEQINGGYSPACTILIKGVPYASANNAGQINAGIEIINVVSRYHGISAPIFKK